MIITCPKCEIQYSVEPDGFGSSGRKVRCFSCAYQWFQHPVTVNVPRAAPPAPPPPPPPAPPPPPNYPPVVYPPPGYVLTPESQLPPAGAGQAAMAGAGAGASLSETMDEPRDGGPQETGAMAVAPDIDAMFEPEDVGTGADATTDNAAEDPITEMSQDDLDAMFETEYEPVALKSMVDEERDSSRNDDNNDDITDIDDIPDPDPLPVGLTGDRPDDDLDLDLDLDDDDDIPVRRRKPARNKPPGKKKKSRGGLVFMSILIVLAGLGCSVVFLRDMIIRTVPEAAPVYAIIDPALESAHEMIGPVLEPAYEIIDEVINERINPLLEPVYEMIGLAPSLGKGLEIGNVASERTSEGEVDVLVVSGNISNVSGDERAVPLIKAMLMDSDGTEIQSVVQEPDMDMIPDGEALNFTIMMKDPSPLARRLEVTFAPRPNSDPGESMQ